MKINILDIPVYYINLKRDVEKNKSTLRALKLAGFKNITRFEGIVGDQKRDGCAKSHQALLSKIDHDGPFIVFEDDVVTVNEFNPILDVPDNADAVYLGISRFALNNGKTNQNLVAEYADENFFRIYNMLAAHAILYLNKDYSKFISKAIQAMLAVDRNQDNARAETMKYFNVYALDNPIFYQDGKHEQVTKFTLSTARLSPYSIGGSVTPPKGSRRGVSARTKESTTLLGKEFLDSPPKVDIIILSWKRQQNIQGILESLSKQTYKNFSVHISNGDLNRHRRIEQVARFFSNEFRMKVFARPDGNELFAFRRLLVAKELAKSGSDIIMFIDDDVTIPNDYVETCLSQYEPMTYASGFAWSLYNNGNSYYDDRKRQSSNDYKIQYCGTGISMCDASIFLNEELTDLKNMPSGALKVEDLWLSFIAQHRLGWKLKYLDMPGVVLGGGDRVALYRQIASEPYDKADFLRDLVKMGWKIPKGIVKA